MKKHFIFLSTFAALLLSATLLTACGENVQELADNGNNGETVTETTTGENCTVFSTGDDDTRTWMDANRQFYWSDGDQIYVNTESTNFKKTTSSTLYENDKKADFVLEGVTLTEPKCSVIYIGNGTTAATPKASDLKVKIEQTQTQSQWGNSAHLGASGDCGVAEATKVGGKYGFKLTHKAAYLVLQPYRPSGKTNPNWKLTKIEIIANGTTLAGTYDFSIGELVGTGSSNTIEFNCGTDGFDLNHTAASATNSCFAVIQPCAPGTTHELTIRYTVKVPGKENVYLLGTHGGDFGTMFFEKKIAAKPYNPNGVTTIKHELFFAPLYYQWGATDTYFNTYQTNAYDQTTMSPTQLANPLWDELPNANEIYSYIAYGDPRWDGTTVWSRDGGLTEYTGGIWLKTRSAIGPQFSDVVGVDGVDMRSVFKEYLINTTAYQTGGKPAASVIGKYSFLPALGICASDISSEQGVIVGRFGYYWSRSPEPNGRSNAYCLYFNNSVVNEVRYSRTLGFVLAPGWFW